MNFKMNDRIYTIKKVSQNELWGDSGNAQTLGRCYFGRFNPLNQEIWLNDNLTKQQEKKTLMHELMHCYIFSYMTEIENFNEEDICNLSANSHNIINKIVKNYFGEVN